MSAVEETLSPNTVSENKQLPLLDRFMNFISSVRFGVSLLCVLVVFSMIGMLIVQQNVEGFDAYYAGLTPAEKVVFGSLGFFDIYHGWYFSLTLLIVSLNIVLASIERFPSAWAYIKNPKLTATEAWLKNQPNRATFEIAALDKEEAARAISDAFVKNGYSARASDFEYTEYARDDAGNKRFSEMVSKARTLVFGEKGRFNRLGAYVVHVFLLTLFLGHFVALRTGFDADVRMTPGETSNQIQLIEFNLDKKEKFNVQLPFSITCTDIQQRLIDPQGNIEITNTLDWRTQIKIDDPEYGVTVADVSLNSPYSYRGYRFFQAQTVPLGNARVINLELTPQNGGQPVNVEIPRQGTGSLPDGTTIEYEEFLPDFAFGEGGKPDTRSGEYNNPAAVLNVTPPGGQRTRVYAFAAKLADNIPVGAPKVGYKWRLASFEKSPYAHILSIKYDPYDAAFIAWYIGGFGLLGALAFVFFSSHRRVWALLEQSGTGLYTVTIGGNANRNHLGFEEKFKKIVADLGATVETKGDEE